MIKIKQVVAFGLAAAMVFGSTITSFAQETTQNLTSATDGSVTGTTKTVTGNAVNEYVNMKVFKVKVPTDALMNRVLDYHCDPLDLISESGRMTVDGRMDGVYFNRYDGDEAYVSNESEELTVINMSSSGVELDYKVSVDSGAANNAYTGTFATASAVGDDNVRAFTDGNIYFGLIATNSKELALAPSAVDSATTQSNIIYSARGFFKLGTSGSAVAATAAGSYAYAFDSETYSEDDLPRFTFKFIAGLNKSLPDSTWFITNPSQPIANATPYAMPSIKLQFTPKYIDAKPGRIEYNTDDSKLYLYSADDTINFTDMTVSDVKVNGKSVTGIQPAGTDSNGDYTAPYIPTGDVLAVLGNGGTTVSQDDMDEYNLLSGVEWTVQKGTDTSTTVHYYADYL